MLCYIWSNGWNWCGCRCHRHRWHCHCPFRCWFCVRTYNNIFNSHGSNYAHVGFRNSIRISNFQLVALACSTQCIHFYQHLKTGTQKTKNWNTSQYSRVCFLMIDVWVCVYPATISNRLPLPFAIPYIRRTLIHFY